MADIFGSVNEQEKFPGLVDSADATVFNQNVIKFKQKWHCLCPGFFEWFLKSEAELMCSSMITSVHSLAGLGMIPRNHLLLTTMNL